MRNECESCNDQPVPGVLSHYRDEQGKRWEWETIERCDTCERFDSDDDARAAIAKAEGQESSPDDRDWCGYCDKETTYTGHRCDSCGRIWGYDKPGDELGKEREDARDPRRGTV